MSVPTSQDAAAPMPRSTAAAPAHPTTDPRHLLPEHATEPAGHRSRKRLFIVLLIILLVIGFILWRIHANNVASQKQAAQQAAAANKPTPVQTSPVQQKTVPVFLNALGTVTAYNTVTLQPRVNGQLLQVNFREGQNVRKGDLLLQIDPRPYQAALDQAIGTLAKDEANLKDMQAEAERYTSLYEAGVVSKEQQQLEINNSGQAEGTIKSDQAAVEAAKVNLGYTKIYSPIDGVVGLRLVDPGNIVQTTNTTGLVVITQIHPIAVIFTLPEDQLAQVQQAMKGGKKLVVNAYDRTDAHQIASGTLLTIDNQIDTTTGTAKLKAIFDNADGGLFANQFVNVRLVLRERPNAIVVPTAAVESGTQGDYVFVVNPGPTPTNKIQNLPGETPANTTTGHTGKNRQAAAGAAEESEGKGKNGQPRAQYHADIVPVQVDFTIGVESVLVDKGNLKAGQQVVVDGQEKLVDGGNVTPQQARTPPTTNNTNTIGASSSTSTTSQEPSAAQNAGTTSGSSGSTNGSSHQ
jgi:membrane fusion protein, multidrug efflux system